MIGPGKKKKTLRERIRRMDKILGTYHFPLVKSSFKVGEIWEIIKYPNQSGTYIQVVDETGNTIQHLFPNGTKLFLFSEKKASEEWVEWMESHHGSVFAAFDMTTNTKYDLILMPLYVSQKLIRRVSKLAAEKK